MIRVLSKRLGLPIGADTIMWVREDAIVHIKPWGPKCDVTFSTPHYEREHTDGTVLHKYELTVHATEMEILEACGKAQAQ